MQLNKKNLFGDSDLLKSYPKHVIYKVGQLKTRLAFPMIDVAVCMIMASPSLIAIQGGQVLGK